MSAEMEDRVVEEARKKRHNASVRRYMRRRSLEIRWIKGNVYRLADELFRKGVVEELSEESQLFLQKLEEYKPKKTPPLLLKLFGPRPSEGDVVTAKDALERLYKGKQEMSVLVKRWNKAGIAVRYEIDPEGGPLQAKYIIEKIPNNYSGCDLNPDDFLARE